MNSTRLAIISSHPIQYNAPWFRKLAEAGIILKVFYTWSQASGSQKFDPGFGKMISWDIPLLEGYDYTFVENVSKRPGSKHFWGIDNPTLIARIKEWNATVILVYGWSFKSHLQCLRYFKGKIPVLFRGDSTLLDEKAGIRSLMRRALLTWVFRYLDYALYVGNNNKAYFLKHGVDQARLRFVPHAVDNDRFALPGKEGLERYEILKKQLAFAIEDFVILFAGKLEPKKNPNYLIELAKRLPGSQFKFLFVGNGVLEDELKSAATADPRIQFLDFQNQTVMPYIYRLGTVLILPSKGPGETWGLALNEAMASGLPVLASTKVGGAIDMITKENGFIFEVNDVDSTAFYIRKLAENPVDLKKSREISSEILKMYSFDGIVQNIGSLLKELE